MAPNPRKQGPDFQIRIKRTASGKPGYWATCPLCGAPRRLRKHLYFSFLKYRYVTDYEFDHCDLVRRWHEDQIKQMIHKEPE